MGDGIEYVNPRRKSDGYRVVEGKNNTSVVITSGRKPRVKKSGEVCPLPKTIHHRGVVGVDSNQTPKNTETYLTFVLSVRVTHLWVAPYTEYQQFLFVTINDFREKGWNYRQIAYWLNQNDYKTPRGKMFHGSHAHSIVKK